MRFFVAPTNKACHVTHLVVALAAPDDVTQGGHDLLVAEVGGEVTHPLVQNGHQAATQARALDRMRDVITNVVIVMAIVIVDFRLRGGGGGGGGRRGGVVVVEARRDDSRVARRQLAGRRQRHRTGSGLRGRHPPALATPDGLGLVGRRRGSRGRAE